MKCNASPDNNCSDTLPNMGQAAREQQITSVGSLSRVGTGAAQLGHISFNIITFVCYKTKIVVIILEQRKRKHTMNINVKIGLPY